MIDFLLILLVIFIFISGVASSSETALFSLSSIKVRTFKNSDSARKRLIFSLLSKPRDLLITILMLNILVNILVQNIVSSIFVGRSSWYLSVGLPVLLVLIFGEIIPKAIGLLNNERIAIFIAPILKVIQGLFWPLRIVLSKLSGFVSHVMFFFLKKDPEISVEELYHALGSSSNFGVISSEESDLVKGYLKLEESSVKQLMSPEDEIVFFDISQPLSTLENLFVTQKYSRLPVYKDGPDNILGIITMHNFFLHKSGLQDANGLLKFLNKPFYVPETMAARVLLNNFYRSKESMALVVDEYGSITGIITIEDLVRVVIGEIYDSRDTLKHYTRASSDVIIASGKLELSEFEQIFGIKLTSEHNMVTIGGWLMEKMGEIPASGVHYKSDGFLFQILQADRNRIKRVYIKKVSS